MLQKQPPASQKPDIALWFREYSESLHDDPYPFYAHLLEHDPVYYIEERNLWVVSRYDDVSRILKDPLFVREYRNTVPEHMRHEMPAPPAEWKPIQELLDNWMLNRDAPAHTKLRGHVSHAFTPRMMEGLKSKIRSIAEYLADKMEEEQQPDLIASFAFPLPVIVIAELLGVPPEDRELFKGWSNVFARLLEGIDQSPQFAKQAGVAIEEISDYFSLLMAKRKSDPQEDMISKLVAAQGHADALSDQEIIATCVLLLVAGHETTVNLIGNSIHTMLNHPEHRATLLDNPDLIDTAVEEILRFESPVQMTSRFASVDYEIGGGRTIRQGQAVTVMLGAANRDPAKFENPDRFDSRRSPNRHLAFGSGSHFCLGAPLARMEREIALATLLQRFPALCPVDYKPNWRPFILLRGLETMPVRL